MSLCDSVCFHKIVWIQRYTLAVVLFCLVLPSKQVRDLLVAKQPSDTHDPDAADYLLVDKKRRTEQNPPALKHTDNATQRGLTYQKTHWRGPMSNSLNGNLQLTASLRRQYMFPSRPYPDAMSSKYRVQLAESEDSKSWNNSGSIRSDRLATHRIPTNDELTPDSTDSAGFADDFVGPDGKLRMSICDHPNGFLRRQKKLCKRYLHLMESVVRGYFMGLRECEYRFSMHRWNCQGHNLTLQIAPKNRRRLRHRQSSIAQTKPVRIKTYLDKLLSKGTRESAYVLAVTSAGVSHAVTKACSSGLHENCGCDRTIYDHPREPNFEWSGCSDNIHFGAAFSRQFLDVRERSRLRRRPKLAMTNLHNNHVGRQAVINKMEVQCKCHGVSGSCEMRTCWRSLPKFRDLGAHLQDRFQQAILVDYVGQRLVRVGDEEELSSVPGASNPLLYQRTSQLAPERNQAPTENDMLYIARSPTFCHHDPGFGSLGTYGRQCVEDSREHNSCDYLCCGRGFKRETTIQEERCNCKFQWCCKVLCQTCRKTVVRSTCN